MRCHGRHAFIEVLLSRSRISFPLRPFAPPAAGPRFARSAGAHYARPAARACPCARGRGDKRGAGARKGPGPAPGRCHVLSCDVMAAMPSSKCCRPIPAYRSSIAFRSVRAAQALRAARPCFARNRAPLRVRACARHAPARFAHLIARARQRAGQRAHSSRPLTPGRLRRPSRPLPAEKPKGGPGSRLSHAYSTTLSVRSSLSGNKNDNIG